MAADTLIRSIVVWRPAIQTPSGASYKLWITGVDSAGTPDKYRVVLEGPVVTVPFGDGVHPIKIEFSFDPPFALPGLGRYFFAVQDYCGSHFDLLTSLEDAYAEGSLWRTGISCLDGCSYLGPLSRLTASDLVFTIEFCGDTATTVRRNSWGRLKILYR